MIELNMIYNLQPSMHVPKINKLSNWQWNIKNCFLPADKYLTGGNPAAHF
ncbi:hypothetical protein [Mucilaginibacter dorajii]|nr:hypothetical protein [Mucilaginibacter dorajii]MCS3737356.1 hypothetical protein [Mucilaginibacter dorajii]